MPATKFPPGPRSALPAGLLFRFRRDPIGFLMGIARDHGDIASFAIGPQRLFVLNHPDLIQQALVVHNRRFVKAGALNRSKFILGEGLLTSEGEHHLRQRRLMQPAFHRQRIGAYADTMAAYAGRLADRFADGETREIGQDMMHLTLAIVGKTLFDADVEQEAAEVETAVNDLYELFDTIMLPWSAVLQRLPTASNRRAWAGLAKLDAIVYRLIAERRAAGTDRGDLLSMLIAARDEGEIEGMTDRQVRDEAMTLFLAGHETTANALTWCWYLLSQHPEVASRLEAEAASVLGGRLPTMEDLPRLTYTDQVFAESLRLYPPGWAVLRRAVEDVELGGYTIPKGALVIMSPFVRHRDPRYFPAPERFDPERFSPEAKAERPKFAYFPFSGGARGCIGEPFAWMEAMIILATFASRWRLRLAPGHPVEPEPLVTLRPKFGMRMIVEAVR